ncbi:MAG: alpha/beta hydrolase, partial [Geminicoccaceae bacterium]|nr:alpha/beta hydrolase [Geminicoccaceae bacterium]
MRPRLRLPDLLWLVAALGAIALALHRLEEAGRGVVLERLLVEGTIPAELVRLEGAPIGPVVVVAHGFSGSTVLMRSLALSLAANGLAVLAFDFPGHGRHPVPLDGDLFRVEGAAARLVAATRAVLAEARRLGDGRVALSGHSMAGDVIVRTAALEPDVAAVVAISLFSPAVTEREPRNLLVIAGAWEGRLAAEALRVAGLASAPAPPAYGVTYGRFEDGTARRAVVAPLVE